MTTKILRNYTILELLGVRKQPKIVSPPPPTIDSRSPPQRITFPSYMTPNQQDCAGERLTTTSIRGASSGSPGTNPYPPLPAVHSAHKYPASATPNIYAPMSSSPGANITKMSEIPVNPTSAPYPKSSESPKYPGRQTAERGNSKYLPLPPISTRLGVKRVPTGRNLQDPIKGQRSAYIWPYTPSPNIPTPT